MTRQHDIGETFRRNSLRSFERARAAAEQATEKEIEEREQMTTEPPAVQIRISEAARKTARIRAAFEELTLEEWVTRAIIAQAEREEAGRR